MNSRRFLHPIPVDHLPSTHDPLRGEGRVVGEGLRRTAACGLSLEMENLLWFSISTHNDGQETSTLGRGSLSYCPRRASGGSLSVRTNFDHICNFFDAHRRYPLGEYWFTGRIILFTNHGNTQLPTMRRGRNHRIALSTQSYCQELKVSDIARLV